MRGAVVGAAGLLLLAGCAADGEPPAPEAGRGPETTFSGMPLPPPPDPAKATPGWGELEPARDGEAILPGVLLLAPALDPDGTARFRVRNGAATDLPDLILAVIFGIPSGETPPRHDPRIETLEAPMARGEEREFRVSFPGRGGAGKPDRFRVAAGLPEMLTAREEGSPGTTFLGGLLECVRLDADLTSESPRVTVGLEERGTLLPDLETRLFLARGGAIVWTGNWILLPRPATEGSRERGVTWRLPRDLPTAGCSLYLRVREKR